MDETFDLGLICATREEFDHCRELAAFTQIRSEGAYLYTFELPGSGRRGVAVPLFDMGLVPATQAATSFLGRYDVSVLALVGIAGALHRDLRLGDVVVASAVDSYLASSKIVEGPPSPADGKASAPGGSPGPASWHIERAGQSLPLSSGLKAYVNNFRYADDGVPFARWRASALTRRSGLTGGAGDGGPEPGPSYHLMPVATGDTVITSESFATWVRDGNRLRGAVEMEAGGVAHAVYALESGRPTEFLVVRGISDFADSRKSLLDEAAPRGEPGAWRKLATQNAFSLLLELTGHPFFPWRGGPARQAAARRRLASYRHVASRAAVVAEAAVTLADAATTVEPDGSTILSGPVASLDPSQPSPAHGDHGDHGMPHQHPHAGVHGGVDHSGVDPGGLDTDSGFDDMDGGSD
ncbi:hypothetical protein ACIQPQ_27165 [Streptomyces sp. NPDC091281]|uniref:5'-methylthioadenosine/S-adenosylhomocysteine nucleosidase family protein n=1 Tax=Streptomyces sp. NPDC091281 TaxID=3365985 RepID=UPI00382CA3C4